MKEIERKFKYNSDVPFNGATCFIEQAYIAIGHDRYIRVRKRRDSPSVEHHTLTFKKIIDEQTREEINVPISEVKYREFYNMGIKFLRKYRCYRVWDFDGGRIEFSRDRYVNVKGDIMAEYIEAELIAGSKFPDSFPDFCGEEVTGKPEHTNLMFASEE